VYHGVILITKEIKMEQQVMEEASQIFAINTFSDIILDSGAHSVLGMIKQINPDAYQELVMAYK
jgi:hypothetical protein